jgi:hypothetical protein
MNEAMRKAQDAVDMAVREMVRVFAENDEPLIGEDDRPAMVAGYIVIVDGVAYHPETNRPITSIGHIYDGGSMGLPQAVGLMKLGMWSLMEGPDD